MGEFTSAQLAEGVRYDVSATGPVWWDPTGKFTGALFAGSVPEAEVRSLLDWTPEEKPVYVIDIDQPMGFSAIPGRKAICGRSGSVLYFASGDVETDKGYRVHPYYDTLVTRGVGRIITEAGEPIHFGTVGCLGDGRIGWVQVRPPQGITTKCGVDLLPWIGAMSSLDGSVATQFACMSTNMICDNTFRAGVGEAKRRGSVKVRHTRNSLARIGNVADALGLMWESTETLAAEIDTWADVSVSDAQWSAIVDLLAPMPTDEASKRSTTMAETKRDDLTRLYRQDPRCAPWNGTALGVVQAFNTYAQHMTIVRNAPRQERRIMLTMDGTYANGDAETLAAVAKATGASVLQPA